MNRSTRLIVVAIAAAALVPGAYAKALPSMPEEPGATAADWVQEAPVSAGVAPETPPCGWVVFTDDLGIPWYAPGGACTAAPEPAADPGLHRAPAVDATGITNSPYSGWIVVTDDLGVQWLVPVAYAAPSTVDAPRAVTATKQAQTKPSKAKQRGFWGMITENSRSQNRVAPRKVAATRTLASTLWTRAG